MGYSGGVIGREDMFSEKAGFQRCLFEIQIMLQRNTITHSPRDNLQTELDLLWKRHNLVTCYQDEEYIQKVKGLTEKEMKNSLLAQIENMENDALTDARKRAPFRRLLRKWEAAQHILLAKMMMYKDDYRNAVF